MEFVNPGFLFGLFAVAVPVIIHLFNFRRFRKVYFTNVKFIRELKQETQRQSNLKHLLVLLARILAVSAIVIAFARPYIPLSDNLIRIQEKNSISIYIDNSFSMQAETDQGNLLQTALDKARDIASVYKSSDRFQLLTNDFEGRHLRFVSREEFLDLLDEVDFSPVVKNFEEVHLRQSELQKLEPAAVKSAYVLSDFQDHFLDSDERFTDTLVHTFLLPLQSVSPDNLYIDTCWFEAPVQQVNQLVKAWVRMRNSSGNAYEDIPVKLKVDGSQRALASFNIGPGGEAVVELTFTNADPGIHSGELEINDFPVTFDDRFYFSYRVNPVIRVLSIHEDSPDFYLNSLFRNDSSIRLDNMGIDQLNFSALQDYQFIILNSLHSLSSGLIQELARFIRAGGSVLVIPSPDPALGTYNDFLGDLDLPGYGVHDTVRQRVGSVNLEHPLYEGVFDEVPENMDLPVVESHYRIKQDRQQAFEVLMGLQNGDVFLGLYPVDRGKLYLLAVPLIPGFSNFQQHPLFVPTFYKMAVSSAVTSDLFYTLGRNEVIRVEQSSRAPDEVLKITSMDNSFEVIPEHRRVGHMEDLFVYGQISDAGNYLLTLSGEPVLGISFNYDRRESEMRFHSAGELKQIISERQMKGVHILEPSDKPVAQSIADMGRGVQLWRWFVLAALFFLLAESLLLRFLK